MPFRVYHPLPGARCRHPAEGHRAHEDRFRWNGHRPKGIEDRWPNGKAKVKGRSSYLRACGAKLTKLQIVKSSNTRLSSDMKDGTKENYFTGEQRLNYIGIPVNMKYNAWSYKRFNLYGSAGVLVEKCISGNVTKEYVINNATKKKETVNIDSKPLQMSVNAAIGISDHHHWYGIMRQHPKNSNGRCIRQEYKTYDRRRFSL